MVALFLGVALGALAAVAILAGRSSRARDSWAATPLPFGTFLCIGGIITALWGQQILAAYLRWSGF
jgi:leader peptidase (prepilin peptidase) / N-methyltransferase